MKKCFVSFCNLLSCGRCHLTSVCCLLSVICCLLFVVSCSDDDFVPAADDRFEVPAGYGTVSFEMVRYNVYGTVTSLSEARTIKVVVVNSQAEKIELPSLMLTGNEDLIKTAAYPLPAGHYIVQSYRCFDLNGDLIESLDVTMTKENEFDVVASQETAMGLTVQVKNSQTISNVYNTLYGLCLEVLGSDKSKWPKSWDFDGEGIDGSWAGLEFEWDVATDSPIELIGLVINGEEDYILNSDTWELELASLPEFKHMKKLPGCLANLTKLDGITIMNCDMEEIDPEFQYSPITSMTITNTKLKRIPDELGNLRSLCDVWIEGNELEEFPTALTRCENLYAFVLKDEPKVSYVPESIGNWGTNLISLNISGTGISELPDVFDKLWKVSSLELEDNPNLATLPATIGLEKVPYEGGGYSDTGITGLYLDGCGFTSIPDVAKRKRLQVLSMSRNKLTSVSKEDFDAMSDLQALYLNDNRFSSFPALTNPQLGYLSLMRCGLHKSDIDISGLPMLNPKYSFYCEE